MGIRGNISRNTLANANKVKDWRIYSDFARLYAIHQTSGFFVIRAKRNFNFRRLYSHTIDKSTGIQCDQTIVPRTSMLKRTIRKNHGESGISM